MQGESNEGEIHPEHYALTWLREVCVLLLKSQNSLHEAYILPCPCRGLLCRGDVTTVNIRLIMFLPPPQMGYCGSEANNIN